MNRRNNDNRSMEVRRYQSGRSNLLLMMIFTCVNTVLAAVGEDTYYLFTNYAAYMSALIGRMYADMSGEMLYLYLGVGAAVLLLLPYLICWLLSKKRRGALIAALVFFAIDTVMLAVDALAMGELAMLMDLAFHVMLLVILFLAVRSGRKALEEMSAPPAVEDTEFFDASLGGRPDTPALGVPQEEKKYRILVQAQHGGRTIEVRRSYGLTELVVDGRLYGTWEGVSESNYTIEAQVGGHKIATSLTALGKQTIEVDGEVIAKKQRLF